MADTFILRCPQSKWSHVFYMFKFVHWWHESCHFSKFPLSLSFNLHRQYLENYRIWKVNTQPCSTDAKSSWHLFIAESQTQFYLWPKWTPTMFEHRLIINVNKALWIFPQSCSHSFGGCIVRSELSLSFRSLKLRSNCCHLRGDLTWRKFVPDWASTQQVSAPFCFWPELRPKESSSPQQESFLWIWVSNSSSCCLESEFPLKAQNAQSTCQLETKFHDDFSDE